MQTAIEQAIDEGKAHGHTIFGAVVFPNPKDHHLVKVLVKKPDNEFVVWTFNTQDGGFHDGRYFLKNWPAAIEIFVEGMYHNWFINHR